MSINDQISHRYDQREKDSLSKHDANHGIRTAASDCYNPKQIDGFLHAKNPDNVDHLNVTNLWDHHLHFGDGNSASAVLGLDSGKGQPLDAQKDPFAQVSKAELQAGMSELSKALNDLAAGDSQAASADLSRVQYWLNRVNQDMGASEGVSGGNSDASGSAGTGTDCGGTRSGGHCGSDSATSSTGSNSPSPSAGSDGPAPSTGSDNPAPSTGADGPSPSTGSDNPAPSTGADNPPPATGADNPATGSIEGTGNFLPQNGLIYDPQGNVYKPNGTNVSPDAALRDIDKITNDWKFNFIRLDCGVNTDPNQIKQIVDAYTKRGVVVELEDHDNFFGGHSGELLSGDKLNQAAQWYSKMASTFKDNPRVWFGSINEQGTNDTSQEGAWMNEALTIARAIRATGAQNIIVQGDTNWGTGASGGGPSYLLKHAQEFEQLGNIVAGAHVYNNNSNSYDQLTSYVDNLRAQGLPLVFDEYDHVNYIPQEISNQAGGEAALKAIHDLGVGGAVWRWEPDGNGAGLTYQGNGLGGLTPWGQQVWNSTHAG